MPQRTGFFPSFSALLLLPGCFSSSLYGGPRTTPVGTFSHAIGAEVAGRAEQGRSTAIGLSAPVYALRYGLHERADLGLSIRNVGSPGLDLKVNPLRSRHVDLAAAPGLVIFPRNEGEGNARKVVPPGAYLHLPVVLGLNLTPSYSAILTPGAMVVLSDGNQEREFLPGGRVVGRLGGALQARISRSFALQPEVTVLRPFSGPRATFFNAGIGFLFGSLPAY